MALESTNPYARGSAEYTATCLASRGLGCLHPAKYHVDDANQAHSKYPSRLGFFHLTAEEPRISFLDTRKLCNACLDLVVPNGFNFWSTYRYSIVSGTSAAGQEAPKPRWLDMTPSSKSYPPLIQAGTEGFAHVSLATEGLPIRMTTPPVVLRIPKVPGAKEAWDWLQTERKPFYIDQLHLTKGWSLIMEMRAKTDSLIAERAGIGYLPEAQPRPKSRKSNSSAKRPFLLENGPQTFTTTLPKAKNKIKAASEKLSALAAPTELAGYIPELDYVSQSLKVNQREQHTSLGESTPSKADKVSKKIKSTEKPAKEPSSTTKRSSTPEKKKMETALVENASLGDAKKTLQFTFTRNWDNEDPIPFDGPKIPQKLSDYNAQMTNRPVIGPESNYSLEKLMSGMGSIKCKPSSPGHASRIDTPATAAFLQAAGIGESKTRTSKSTLKEKVTHGASIDKSTTKTNKTKTKHDKSHKDKACRKSPTKDKPLMTTKAPVKQRSIENEPAQSSPKKELKAPKGSKAPSQEPKAPKQESKGDGHQQVEPAKPPKIRLPQQDKPLVGLSSKPNSKPHLENTKSHLEHTKPHLEHTKPHLQHTKPHLEHTKPHLEHTKPHLEHTNPHSENTKPRFPMKWFGSGKNEVAGSDHKLSSSNGARFSESSKHDMTSSSNAGTINISNHYTETSVAEISVNDTLLINEEAPVEDTSQSSDEEGSNSDSDKEEVSESEVEVELEVEVEIEVEVEEDEDEDEDEEGSYPTTDSDNSGASNDSDDGNDADSDNDDDERNGNGTDSDDDDGSDGKDGDSDDNEGNDENGADSDNDDDESNGNGTDSDGDDGDDGNGSDNDDDDGNDGSEGSGGQSDGSDDDNDGNSASDGDDDHDDARSGGDSDGDGNGTDNSRDCGDSDDDD
ncbi:hypothetical protein F5Y08DRAFT_345497 [Xylaria arbuscula]|nr:hypothetical protein F5Y08DRAFT_345497 [Xylaria arbuscula]